ncbi:hypothetical protein FPV67DRAFT_1452776 [Lyophyllum atratum]|nr:hypothetical protein FPV67DRAFT_1452776 [Lyophyllum atratum]
MAVLSSKERIKGVSLACETALFSDGENIFAFDFDEKIGMVNLDLEDTRTPLLAAASRHTSSIIPQVLTRIYGKEALARHNYSTIVNSLGVAETLVGMLPFGELSLRQSWTKVRHEYPCGSVVASEQSEEPGINKNARHRWLGLATITMLVFGFAVASFTSWVLYIKRRSRTSGIPGGWIWTNLFDTRGILSGTRVFPYKLVIRRYWASLSAISVIWSRSSWMSESSCTRAPIALLFMHPLTPEGIAGEDRDRDAQFREYLEDYGYETSLMGLGSEESGCVCGG